MNYPAYPEYKPSGVEWLGDMPAEWEVKRLKYSASINDEALPETTDPSFEFSYVDISSVDSVAGIVNTEDVVFEDAPSRARRIVREGDTIVSTVRTYLRAIAPIKENSKKLIVSTGFAVVRPRTIDPAYLSFAVRESGFVDTVVALSVGVSYPAVNASDVATISIPLPSLTEQHSISTFLDYETAKIDTLITKRQALIEKLREKRSALISQTVTRGLPPEAARAAGLDPHPPLKPSGVEWLGDVPEHWVAIKANLAFSIQLGKMLQPEADGPDDEEVPYLKAQHVQWETVKVNDLPIMWASENDRIKYAVSDGDLLVCEGGEVGRAGIVSDPPSGVIIQNALHRVRPKNSNQTRFLLYILEHASSHDWFNILCNRATIAHFTGEKFGSLPLQIPPVDEQQTIVKFLDHETAKIDKMISLEEILINRMQEYRSSLITAAVTGKIDVRGVSLPETTGTAGRAET